MFVPDKSKVPIFGDLVETIKNIPHLKYFSELKHSLGLEGKDVIVEKRGRTELEGHVYAVGTALPNGRPNRHRLIYGLLYRGSQKDVPDKYDGIVKKEEVIEGNFTEEQKVSVLETKIYELRKVHDIPKKV